MRQSNCWEHTKCGRERGGPRAAELGVCPAYTFEAADGFLGGRNGGRGCVYISGTFCSGAIQGTHREKDKHCQDCGFYKHLRDEHGSECSVLSFSAHVRRNEAGPRSLTRHRTPSDT